MSWRYDRIGNPYGVTNPSDHWRLYYSIWLFPVHLDKEVGGRIGSACASHDDYMPHVKSFKRGLDWNLYREALLRSNCRTALHWCCRWLGVKGGRCLGTLAGMFKRIMFLKTTIIFRLARSQEVCTKILFFDCVSVAVVAYQTNCKKCVFVLIRWRILGREMFELIKAHERSHNIKFEYTHMSCKFNTGHFLSH